MGKPSSQSINSRLLWQGPLLIILVVGLIVIAMDIAGSGSGNGAATGVSSTQSTLPNVPNAGAPNSLTPGLTPEPWYYNEATNQHWHAGHGHWHDGPPPPPEQRGDAAPMTTTTTQSSSGQPTITTSIPNQPASTPASGEPDAYGRLPGDQHYGHNHP